MAENGMTIMDTAMANPDVLVIGIVIGVFIGKFALGRRRRGGMGMM